MYTPDLPRILLVHGALADGSSWGKVIPSLQASGYEVTATQEPLTSLPDDIRTVKSAIQTLNQNSSAPIVVVGHSFGGFMITNAAVDEPNIKSLVYVMGFAPDEGETAAELGANFPAVESAKLFAPVADGRVALSQPDYLTYFAPDVAPVEAKSLAATQGPFDPARFTFPSGPPAWKQVKNLYYITASNDQIIPPEEENFFAHRMGAKLTTLEGASHAGLWSQGEEVAKVILEAARC
jgi:pimeloyl-ACP methyl ester carboxylesterase